MDLKHLLAAASAAALIGGAAYAQDAMPEPSQEASSTMESNAQAPAMDAHSDGASTMAADADATMDAAASAESQGRDVSTVVPTEVVAMAPIPDTPENRQMYGEPMSNAGKRSAAQGN